MNKKKVLSMMMTAVLTFTSVAPQLALSANAEGDMIIEEVNEEDTVSDNDSEEAPEEGVSKNEAFNDTVSENEADSISENEPGIVSGNEAVSENETDERALPGGIKGMPEGYMLSERESEIKADMISHGVLATLKDAVAGVDYIEDRVYCIADTEEYAQQIADAYGIELVEYAYTVAIYTNSLN